jgi:hypothetical protein
MPNVKKKAPKSNNRTRPTPTTRVPALPGHRKTTIAPIDAHHLLRMTQQAPTNGPTTAPRAPHTTSNLSIAVNRTEVQGRDTAWLARTIIWGMARRTDSGRARIISRSCGMTIRRVICGDDVAFVGGCGVMGGGEQSRSCMYLGGPSSRATYYLERDAIVVAQHVCFQVGIIS